MAYILIYQRYSIFIHRIKGIFITLETSRTTWQYLYVAFLKQHVAIECELHCTISLVTQVIKRTFTIILRKIKKSNTSRNMKRSVRCLVKDKSKWNATFWICNPAERCIEHQQDIYGHFAPSCKRDWWVWKYGSFTECLKTTEKSTSWTKRCGKDREISQYRKRALTKRQMTFIGHTYQYTGLEKLLLTDRVPSGKSFGRPRYELIYICW